MKCNFAFILSVFIALLFINKNIIAQNDDQSKNELTDWIDNQFEKGMKVFNIPGATFMLMRGDSVLHMRGYGYENMETKVEVEAARSIFHIASISKTFVAVAIMKLYQEGKVDSIL